MPDEKISNDPDAAVCGIRDKADGCRVTLDQVSRLPLYYRETIPMEYLDPMGHMNVRWYMALFDSATWRFFEAVGLTLDYFRTCNAGGFALRHFIQYWNEVHAGDQVVVRTRVLGRSDKRFHFMHFMIDETGGRIAATLESLGTHADLALRKSSPLPHSIAERFDRFLAHDSRMEWQAPTSGAITI